MSRTTCGLSDPESRLLSLPAELRCEIYTFIMPQGETLYIRQPGMGDDPGCPPEPALMLVNRQLRQESMELLYGNNTFQAMGSETAINFLTQLGEERVRMLKCFRLGGGRLKREDQLNLTCWSLNKMKIRGCLRWLKKKSIYVPFITMDPDKITYENLCEVEELEICDDEDRDFVRLRKVG